MDSKKGHGRYCTCWTPSELFNSDNVLEEFANYGFIHHYEKNSHHPEHYKGAQMDDIALVEAIVDGLACIFERNTKHTDVLSWLDMYQIKRFTGLNVELAERIMNALRVHITEADYKVLKMFRESISLLIGESEPWSQICCNPNTVTPRRGNPVPSHDLASCFL